MCGAVLVVRSIFAGSEVTAFVRLLAEVAAGAVTYLLAIPLVARRAARDLLDKLRVAFRPQAAA
jgi:hypothetical protein